jgi:hypothetical protein
MISQELTRSAGHLRKFDLVLFATYQSLDIAGILGKRVVEIQLFY